MAAEFSITDTVIPPDSSIRPRGDRLPIAVAVGIDTVTLLLASAWLAGILVHPVPHRHALASAAPVPNAAPVTTVAPVSAAAWRVPGSTLEPVTPDQAQLMNAAVPISTLPNPAAEPFRLKTLSAADRAAATTCLTMAVYYEAGNQGDQGEAAVAQVVLNRLRNPLFPKTVCGVVFEGSTLPTGCQFTFACDGSLNRPPSKAGWKQAEQVAERALDGYVQPSIGEATHYHTIWVVPYWQSSLVKVAQIGAHIFYRWPGPLGMPVSFRGQYAGLEQPPSQIATDLTEIGPPPTSSPPPPIEVAELATPIAPVAPPVEVAHLDSSAAPAIPITVEPLPGAHHSNPRLPMPTSW